MSKLSDEFEWTPHIHNNGSREHVLAYGSLTERGGPTAIPVTWCSHPFCANNRDTLDFLEEVRRGPPHCSTAASTTARPIRTQKHQTVTLLRPYSNWKGRLVFLAIDLGKVGVAYLVGWVR